MSATAGLEDLYLTIEESARRLGVTCSREKVWPILTTYGDALGEGVIAFRVATGARHMGELDCRFLMLPKDVDPYALALANGLTEETDHPVGALFSDIRERCPIDSYGIDFGVVGGFAKTWSFFPADGMQQLSRLAEIPSMPAALAGNAGFFTRRGLDDKVTLVGIDYPHRTANVYFGGLPAECLEPKAILSMLHELELPEPSGQMLELGQKAFGLYATLSWDSSRIERFSFAVMIPDAAALPTRIAPEIERLLESAPGGAGDRKVLYVAASSNHGEYYKLQTYHQWRPLVLSLMLPSDSVGDSV